MNEFSEAINNTYKQLIKEAESKGFAEAQKHFNQRESKSLYSLIGMISEIADSEMQLAEVKKSLTKVIVSIYQYMNYQEIR